MSLVAIVKTPEGIVLAADSRLTAARKRDDGGYDFVFLDNGTKVSTLGPTYSSVAVAFYGSAASGIRSVGSLLAEWSREQHVRVPLEELAAKLHEHLGPKGLHETALYLAGFDETNAFGRIFQLTFPGGVEELHARASTGLSLGGRKELAQSIATTLSPPLDLMPLKASADLARFLIETTTRAQSFSFGTPTVGGDVQLALLERGKPIRLL